MVRRQATKPITFVGASRVDLKRLPNAVRSFIGHELWVVQTGETPDSAKPLKGFGSGVFEVVERFDGDTYRGVYLVRFAEMIYVLHCFQKKSKSGIKLPQKDRDLISKRLKAAVSDHAEMVRNM